MKQKILNFGLFLIASSVYSQQENVQNRGTLETFRSYSSGFWLPGQIEDKTIEGTVYLFPNWNGNYKIISTEGVSSQIFNLNYNIKNKTIESFVSKDSVFQFDSSKIDYLIQSSNKYKLLKDIEFNGIHLEVFSSEKVKLYKSFNVEIQQGVLNPMTQEMIGKSRYLLTTQFVINLDNKYKIIKLKKGTILDCLIDKKEEIKDFVSKNNLNYNNETDVIQILTLYTKL